MKTCRKCGVEKPLTEFVLDAGRWYRGACRECSRVAMEAWRAAHPTADADYRATRRDRARAQIANKASRRREPDKARARRQLKKAVKLGRVVKPQACSSCGVVPPVEALHGHHRDYAQPFVVEWLCATCHLRLHHRMRREATACRAAA